MKIKTIENGNDNEFLTELECAKLGLVAKWSIELDDDCEPVVGGRNQIVGTIHGKEFAWDNVLHRNQFYYQSEENSHIEQMLELLVRIQLLEWAIQNLVNKEAA